MRICILFSYTYMYMHIRVTLFSMYQKTILCMHWWRLCLNQHRIKLVYIRAIQCSCSRQCDYTCMQACSKFVLVKLWRCVWCAKLTLRCWYACRQHMWDAASTHWCADGTQNSLYYKLKTMCHLSYSKCNKIIMLYVGIYVHHTIFNLPVQVMHACIFRSS
jgi:hypothetical protein